MNYIELTIPVADTYQSELLIAELADLPFESFEEEEHLLKAYIPAEKLPDSKAATDALLTTHGITGARYIEIETQNWNAVWESQFDPVEVEGRLIIRAPFHKSLYETPGQDFSSEVGRFCADRRCEGEDSTSSTDSTEHRGGVKDARLPREIIIMPKMSFGTGHHATTWLMSAEMTDHDFTGKRVLDMGSGTGVLAILAAKLGATSVDAIDIDEWAYRNSIENIELNGVAEVVHPMLGDAATIRGRHYDTVLANINRNILLADMPAYISTLSEHGELIVSGILEADIETIERRAVELGLWPASQRLREGWAALSFRHKKS
ncbi:MAG: 50S ribosomal protein L11 methyltransferase [Alistipes sp.]|jgi:ribosomal protein L11 methyltransferase|nr:50S ribosomal protein L11 methyltransferase [Alistipes sp.]